MIGRGKKGKARAAAGLTERLHVILRNASRHSEAKPKNLVKFYFLNTL